jgi:hypothetical protein
VYLYEKITGEQFVVPDLSVPLNDSINAAVQEALNKL